MTNRYGDETDLNNIDRVRDNHASALNAGDAVAWAGLFTDDGVQMPPNAPANVGKEMIAAWSGGFLSAFRVKFALSVDEVCAAGDRAFERGGYAITVTPADGGPSMEDKGKYITVYERNADDEWKMARDIWNSDNPPPGM